MVPPLLLLKNTLTSFIVYNSGRSTCLFSPSPPSSSSSIRSYYAIPHFYYNYNNNNNNKKSIISSSRNKMNRYCSSSDSSSSSSSSVSSSQSLLVDKNNNQDTTTTTTTTTTAPTAVPIPTISKSSSSTRTKMQTWLVIGDGDLSYSASIAESLHASNIQLIATVLEEENVHNRVYERSKQNTNTILSFPSIIHDIAHNTNANTNHITNTNTDQEDDDNDNENKQSQSQQFQSQHQVKFGIDGTKLEFHFPNVQFDCIEFNFPHWRGKTNAKYNRQLLNDFLKSASTVLKKKNKEGEETTTTTTTKNENDSSSTSSGSSIGGEIRIALCHGQGGMTTPIPVTATTGEQPQPQSQLQQQQYYTIQDWRQSWMPAMYAAQHGLVLRQLEPYVPMYNLSSHRGVDRPFFLGHDPQRYIFTFPDEHHPIDPSIQLSCRHELRIMLHSERLRQNGETDNDNEHDNVENIINEKTNVSEEKDEDNDEEVGNTAVQGIVSYNDIVHGDAVLNLAKEFVPQGYRFEIAAKALLTPYDLKKSYHVPLAVFLFNYSGETAPMTRERADTIRANIEAEITKRWGLEIAKGGRLVSRPYPYSLLPTLIKEYNQ